MLALEPAVAFLRAEAVKVSARYERYFKAALNALLTAAGLALVALGVLAVLQGL